jgi:hypothetical protein
MRSRRESPAKAHVGAKLDSFGNEFDVGRLAFAAVEFDPDMQMAAAFTSDRGQLGRNQVPTPRGLGVG